MEKFSPSQPEENKNRSSIAKKVMLGVALAGAAGSLSACKEGDESTLSTGDTEQLRAESIEQEDKVRIQTFIDDVSNMEVGIDDARGRGALLVKVDAQFGVLTDKLYGADNLANRAKTARDILPEMPDQIGPEDVGLIALMALLDKYDLTSGQVEALDDFSDQMSGESKTENGARSGREQGSEVRRIKTEW